MGVSGGFVIGGGSIGKVIGGRVLDCGGANDRRTEKHC